MVTLSQHSRWTGSTYRTTPPTTPATRPPASQHLSLKVNSRRMSGEDPPFGTLTAAQKLDTRGTREMEDELTSQVDQKMVVVVGSLMAEARDI